MAVQEHTLAEVEVDGAHVRFVEMAPGLPIALADSEPGRSPLLDASVAGMTLVEMYEHWTNQPAPEALRAAQERAVLLAQEEAVAFEQLGEDELDLAPEELETVDKLSGDQFAAWYCGGRQICHLYVTGTGEYERRTTRVSGTVNAVWGQVRIQIRAYKVIGGWRTVGAYDVLQDREISYSANTGGGIARPFKVKVYEADGDTYHWAHGWN